MSIVLNTCGDGYWSRKQKAVRVVDMRLGYVNDERDFGELCVYFDTSTWNVSEDGLIYTDSEFLDELNEFLLDNGLDTAHYSEQGMQGDDYVSLDVEKQFIDRWNKKFSIFA